MDPLVRSSYALQQGLAKAWGTGVAVVLGGYLAYSAASSPGPVWDYIALALFGASFVYRIVRRFGRLGPSDTTRLDLEVFVHATLLAYGVVLHVDGGFEGPVYPIVYAVMMLAACFCRPVATVGTVVYAILLEATVGWVVFQRHDPSELWPHAVLIGVFAVLNMVVFRAEIARVRRLSRLRIDGEIQRIKEAARSYRLIGAPSSAAEPARQSATGPDSDDRLVHSGVDEIHLALQFALDVLRRSLGLQTALVLWLDDRGQQLAIQEVSTEQEALRPGPFSARDGIFAAALQRGEPVVLSGKKAHVHAQYYASLPEVGAIGAVPLSEHGHPRGLLVVDRETREPFTDKELELLSEAARFIVRAIENERVFVQLERAKREQGKLYRASLELNSSSTEGEVIEACVGSAREFASFDFAAVTLAHKATNEHEICAVSGDGAEELVGQRFRHNTGLVAMVVANRHPLPYRGDYEPSRQMVFSRKLSPPPVRSLLVLPLLVREKVLGTLVLGSERRGAFSDAVRPTLEVLASHTAINLANARMVKRLEEMATTDGMTGLLNKRTLTEVAGQKLRSAARFKKPLTVVVCDIDHFKKVNDTYGHDVGDVVIKGFAKVLERCKRDTDVVGRFGGEEFVVVCEETGAEGAMLLAERVRTELEATTFHSELGPLSVTCSLGVATYPAAGADFDELFKASDEALYVSKRSGRNRATAWTPGCRAA